jgi:peptide deformylase
MNLIKYRTIEGKISEDVREEELEEMFNLSQEMIEICKELGGIGLAAPQVGIFKNFFIWTRNQGRSFETVFNPSIFRDGGFTNVIEGCLSVPKETFLVKRMKKIRAMYYVYANGKLFKKVEEFKKPFSFVWQHECDHLNGILINKKGELIESTSGKEEVDVKSS